MVIGDPELATKEKEKTPKEFMIRELDGEPLVKKIDPGKLVMEKRSARESTRATYPGSKNATLILKNRLDTGSTISVRLFYDGLPKHFEVVEPPKKTKFNDLAERFPNSAWVSEINVKDLAGKTGNHYTEDNLPYADRTLREMGLPLVA